jgi:hypothetical protein
MATVGLVCVLFLQHAELKVQAMVSQEDVSRAKDQIIETQTKLNDTKSEVRLAAVIRCLESGIGLM